MPATIEGRRAHPKNLVSLRDAIGATAVGIAASLWVDMQNATLRHAIDGGRDAAPESEHFRRDLRISPDVQQPRFHSIHLWCRPRSWQAGFNQSNIAEVFLTERA